MKQPKKKFMAKLDPCINCGNEGQHLHHVVPKALGGNEGSNLVPLCLVCHGLVHNKNFLKSKELQKKGIERAKKEGKYKGRKPTAMLKSQDIVKMFLNGCSTKQIMDTLHVSRASVYRALNLQIPDWRSKISGKDPCDDWSGMLEVECGQTR